MILNNLYKKDLIKPPKFLIDNTHYLTIMGSMAYGVQNDDSDYDIYGFCIPPKEIIFPHLSGEIHGFGRQTTRFEQWQQHGIIDKEINKNYDFSVYNIVKYFHLCMENNPNMIDSLFTPVNAILHCSRIGNIVRENRKIFLHKGSFYKFKGYSYSQIHKMQSKTRIGKRKEDVEKFGYDIKYAYHCVRLLNEVEQILIEHDLDLQKNKEQLKSIRRGEWTLKQVLEYFEKKEIQLEEVYINSNLRCKPDENAIKELLLNCLEEHYGKLNDAVIINTDQNLRILKEIKNLVKDV